MTLDNLSSPAQSTESVASAPLFAGSQRDAAEVTRRCTIAADQSSSAVLPLAEVWSQLVTGQTKAVDAFATGERCYLLLSEPNAAVPNRSARDAYKFDVLARMLLVGAQKSVAFDLGIANSTVALLTKEALLTMGFRCLPSQTPPILVMAAHATLTGRPAVARLSRLSLDGTPHCVVSVARPDLGLKALLPPAEYVVASLLFEGRRRAEIARLRRTSQRTVANQLSGAFQRLRASGRLDLVRRLVANTVTAA